MAAKYALNLLIQICVYKYILDATVSGTLVRLVNGGSHYGTVQVYYNGTWGTICDDIFDNKDATVICRMLGFHGTTTSYNGAHFGQGSGPIIMDNLDCNGRESDIILCPFDGWYNHNCAHSEDAGVDCDVTRTRVRLVKGGRHYGTVQVYYNGTWGTVCDDDFDNKEATVICRMLGFHGNTTSYSGAHFGQGSGPIIMDNLDCNGQETDIALCPFDGWYNHNCAHYEDAGVDCDVARTRVRLVNGGSNYGTVQVYYNGTWGTICDDNFDNKEATVICRMLGFHGNMTSYSRAHFGQGSGPIIMDDLGCYGRESDIALCPFNGWNNHNCAHSEDAGVECGVARTPVRLMNGGSFYGTVQIYYNGTWGTICDNYFDNTEAIVICRMFGFHGNIATYRNAYFGQSSGPVLMDGLNCTGKEIDIADCRFNRWYTHNCGNNDVSGVDCDVTPVRLVHGGADYGTVEIRYNGTWGTLCDDSFDDNEAAVICRMLGKHGTKILAYSSSYFGQGSGPILMDEIRCTGQEDKIGHCPFNGWSNNDCTHLKDAGVNCNDPQANSKPAAECFDTETCPCCNGICPSDGSGQCGGNCRDGYHGEQCSNACPSNCIRCVDAQGRSSVAFCTQCKDGYYSSKSQYQCQLPCPFECKACNSATKCTACRDTTYFLSDTYQCIKCNGSCLTCNSSTHCTSCRDGDFLTENKECEKCLDKCITCKTLSLCTSCKSGYFLVSDEEKCNKCSPLCKSCTSYDVCICTNGCSGNICKDSSGVCTFGCKPNVSYNGFGKCDICIRLRYGYSCDLQCSSSCAGSTCDRVSGACITCTPGYHGDHCDRNCPANCLSTCNKTTGNCDACKEGYYGQLCTRRCPTSCKECMIADGSCRKCKDGFYGVSCDKKCPVHCMIGRCEKTDGSCFFCDVGFEGERCQFEITTTTTTSSNDMYHFVVTQEPENFVGVTVGITLACVVFIASGVAVVIWLYRRRRQNNAGETNRTSIFNVSHRTSHRGNVVEQKCINPYLNTGRADVDTSDNTYEMLQRQPQEERPYSHMKF